MYQVSLLQSYEPQHLVRILDRIAVIPVFRVLFSQLRQFIGKGVSIRGREYWVEKSDMPVVVVGQIVPLAPANEPVMF